MQEGVRHPHELSDCTGSMMVTTSEEGTWSNMAGTHNFGQEVPLGSCLEDIRIEGRASSMKSIMFRRSGETRYGALQNSDSPPPKLSRIWTSISPRNQDIFLSVGESSFRREE